MSYVVFYKPTICKLFKYQLINIDSQTRTVTGTRFQKVHISLNN